MIREEFTRGQSAEGAAHIGELVGLHSRRDLEDEGVTSSWLVTDEKWKKTVSIFQENGMLW